MFITRINARSTSQEVAGRRLPRAQVSDDRTSPRSQDDVCSRPRDRGASIAPPTYNRRIRRLYVGGAIDATRSLGLLHTSSWERGEVRSSDTCARGNRRPATYWEVDRALMRVMNIAVLAVAAVVLPLAAPVQASDGTEITTPYPAVAVEPGETVTFALTVTAPTPRRVDLAVSQLPDGWTATLRGGGLVIDSVMTDPETAPEVQLDVDVPPDASQGVYAAEVLATAAGVPHPLPLQLRVAEAVGGDVTLTAEFPSLQGAADATFSFDLELANNTAEEQTFNLEAAGPEGWQVTATPSQEERAATATVPAGNTATIQVEADPPDTVTAGTYP